jgi:oxygen-independent coproporphyrinogen-3 oxidase
MDDSRHHGLYVHIPFCTKRCGYCSFASGIYEAESASKYLAYVKREAKTISGKTGEEISVDTVYFGGGTPGVLSDAEAVKLMSSVADAFGIKKDAEVSFEANPESFTFTKSKLLRQLGVNRLSFGVQSFNAGILKYLGRAHSADDAMRAVESAKSAGFNNISIDLIYGISGQSMEIWRTDIESALRLEPEHISIYCLSLEPGVPLYENTDAGWPDEDLQAEMYFFVRETFLDAGYNHYEISNFARPGYECRHNLKYWRDEEYLGLGVSAAFHWGGNRYKNPDNLNEYTSSVDAGKWPLASPEPSDPEREMRTAVILGLRLLSGIDLAEFEERFGVHLSDYYGEALGKLLDAELLQLEDGMLRLSPQALFISDEVFSHLI